MKGRRSVAGIKNGGGVSTDLLVCFPTRAHLTLMPKPVSSPSRPLFRARKPTRNQTGSEIGSEPTSPKVTCAGQIKVRPKNRPGSVRSKNWLESAGLKKDVMNFLGALRGLRFNMHCFGSFPGPVDGSSDEEDEVMSGSTHSRTLFSKWFMVMEESQRSHGDQFDKEEEEEEEEEEEKKYHKMPPKNALLLMRCRSAPAKRGEEVAEKLIEDEEEEEENENKRDEESLMLMMSYAPNFFKLSMDIAKETWLVGSVDPLARSRSWRR